MSERKGIFGFGILDFGILRSNKSISEKCHSLTAEEYFVLEKLEGFARMYRRQYCDLAVIARAYQDQKDRESGHYVAYRGSSARMTLLKENIDATREILRGLWRKGMVEPETLHVKTTNEVKFVTPKTKTEAFEEAEKWRITIAGSDCINPPNDVKDCIRAEIDREEKESGKVTIMKAFHQCWQIQETLGLETLKLYTKISNVSKEKGIAHLEKDLGIKLDWHDNITDLKEREAIMSLIRKGIIYVPRVPYVAPT